MRVLVCFLSIVLSTAAFCGDAAKPLSSVAKMDDLMAVVKNTHAKVILLNFWGITCSPCKAEMPALTRASEKFKANSDVAFLGLCIPEDTLSKAQIVEGATEIVQQRKVTYRNLIWSGTGDALLEKFDIQGTPYTVLISPDGKILGEVKVPLNPEQAVEWIEKSILKTLESDKSGETAK